MTIGQAKQIVRFLMGGELYNQYEEKLNTYLDMGQKRIACTTDFIDGEIRFVTEGVVELDLEEKIERFYRVRKVEGGRWERLSPTRIRLYGGDYRIFYNLYPHTITPHTDDNTELEISPMSQIALPYYAASQVTIAEHDLRYHQIYSDQFAAVLENVAQARCKGIHVHTFGGAV